MKLKFLIAFGEEISEFFVNFEYEKKMDKVDMGDNHGFADYSGDFVVDHTDGSH